MYHPLDQTGFVLESNKIGKVIFSVENQLIFENFKRQTKAADFLNTKTRLYLLLFLLKTLLQPTFPLAVIGHLMSFCI